MKPREFDKVVAKLGMDTRDTDHRHAWLVHEGVTVARTKRSHGKAKFVPEFAVRKQLHVDEQQFSGLYSCTVSKDDYIAILKSKGVIAPDPVTEQKPEEKSTSETSREIATSAQPHRSADTKPPASNETLRDDA